MQERRRRYVVLPRQGVLSDIVQASLGETSLEVGAAIGLGGMEAVADASGNGFSELGSLLKSALLEESGVSGGASGDGTAEPSSAAVEMASRISPADFTTVSHKFTDGPALVSLTQTARLAFEAVNPDLRIVEVSTYSLPRMKLGKDKMVTTTSAVRIAGTVAQSARVGGAAVWNSDFKQTVLAASPGGKLGEGVCVAVLDTGVDASHPALSGAMLVSRCLIAGAQPTAGGPVDWGPRFATRAAHGTHVAGIIAARAGHGGPEGVAPEARIASYRIFPDNPGKEKGAENIDIINSIIAAVRDGCHVINLSIEGSQLRADGLRSAIAAAWNQGVICIASAGNGFGSPVSYPAAHHNCIAVTALGRDGTYPDQAEFRHYESDQRSTIDPAIYLASFSNFGPPVQFGAPGHAIVSTFPNNEWWFDSGTSMAAPFVAGMLARLLSGEPAILNAFGDAGRSAAMLKLLIASARVLRLPQQVEEGYGLPS